MRAMILCAGLGTRLRPLTERWPKPAVPLLGQPLIRYNLAVLAAAGVTDVGINTHHLPDEMRRTAEAECARAGLSLTVSHEPVIQGTGGGIRGLRDFLSEPSASGDDFLVMNGDVLFAVDLAPVVQAHRAANAAATMVLLPMPRNETFAAVEVDAQFRVRRIAKHGPGDPAKERLSPWHFSGVHVMSPRVFDFMSPEGEEDINRAVYVRMMEAGLLVRGQLVQGYWSDIGTPARYLAAQTELLFGQVPVHAFPGANPFETARVEGLNRIHPSAKVEGGLIGPAFIDRDARVHPGARLAAGVYVGAGAVVEDGARLSRAAVLADTIVGKGEAVEDTIAVGEQRIRSAAPVPVQR